jgi:hypothetical protein
LPEFAENRVLAAHPALRSEDSSLTNALLGLLLAIMAAALIAHLISADRFLAAMRDEAPRLWSQLGQPRGLIKLGFRGRRNFRQIMQDVELLQPAPRMLYWRRIFRASAAVGVISFALFFVALSRAVP